MSVVSVSNKSDVVISVRGLVKSYGKGQGKQTVIDSLDMDIYAGDFTVIMGSSGAGKSTLLYCLAGMDRVDSGEVVFAEENIVGMSEDSLAVFRRQHCGFVFQNVHLVQSMSLMDNALAAALLVETDKKAAVSRAKTLFEQVNISPSTWEKLPSQVSGGQAARAGIVRSVINKPSVVFADEPTGALNSENSEAVLDVLDDLSREGQTIVMVTHDRNSAIRGNRIIYLHDGNIRGTCELSPDMPREQRLAHLDEFLEEMGW